ncbi:MAG: hypothetical protein HXX18_15010 [Bacteroidetes bacterium]|nr:hypothetical protein [Bacteroidota bacterium]
MKKFSSSKKIKVVISIALLGLIIGALLSFVYTFKYLSKDGGLRIEHRLRDRTTFINKELDIKNIKPWMTFNYLNVIFKLNPLYLKNALNITDFKYPNIRIDKYARKKNINPQLYVEDIKNLIINYPNTN